MVEGANDPKDAVKRFEALQPLFYAKELDPDNKETLELVQLLPPGEPIAVLRDLLIEYRRGSLVALREAASKKAAADA